MTNEIELFLKEDLIKYLRNESNILKSVNKNINEFVKIEVNSNTITTTEYLIILNYYAGLLMTGFGIGWLLKDNYPLGIYDITTATLNFFAANVLMKRYNKNYNIKDLLELISIQNIMNKLNSNIDVKKEKEVEESDGYNINTEINNIETTIEFLQSLTDTEKEKYLEYKRLPK